MNYLKEARHVEYIFVMI